MAKRIMTVDDSPSVRQMVSFTLRHAGYDVVEAADGAEALDRLDEAPVDLVLADVNMPRVDGIELIRKVRAEPKHRFMPIVMLTTESQERRRQEGKTAGATGWIVKPFRPEQLVSVVQRVVG